MPLTIHSEVAEHIEYPFGKGNLTADGIQWSDEVTSDGVTYGTVESVRVNPRGLTDAESQAHLKGVSSTLASKQGIIIELELGITWAQASSSTVYKAIGKVQGRNKDGTWRDLMTEVMNTNAGTTYEEKTYSGRIATTGLLDTMPIDLAVLVKSENAAENAIGKVKNSSYVKAIYRVT